MAASLSCPEPCGHGGLHVLPSGCTIPYALWIISPVCVSVLASYDSNMSMLRTNTRDTGLAAPALHLLSTLGQKQHPGCKKHLFTSQMSSLCQACAQYVGVPKSTCRTCLAALAVLHWLFIMPTPTRACMHSFCLLHSCYARSQCPAQSQAVYCKSQAQLDKTSFTMCL